MQYHNNNNIIKIFMGIIIIKKQGHIIILKEIRHRQIQVIPIRILIIKWIMGIDNQIDR